MYFHPGVAWYISQALRRCHLNKSHLKGGEKEFIFLSPNDQTLSVWRKRFVTVVFDGITIKRNEFFLIAFYEVEASSSMEHKINVWRGRVRWQEICIEARGKRFQDVISRHMIDGKPYLQKNLSTQCDERAWHSSLPKHEILFYKWFALCGDNRFMMNHKGFLSLHYCRRRNWFKGKEKKGTWRRNKLRGNRYFSTFYAECRAFFTISNLISFHIIFILIRLSSMQKKTIRFNALRIQTVSTFNRYLCVSVAKFHDLENFLPFFPNIFLPFSFSHDPRGIVSYKNKCLLLFRWKHSSIASQN